MSRILKKLLFILLIVILLQPGIFAESNQPIPSNFTTYTHEGLFSISYPKEWEPILSIIESMKQKTNEYFKSIGGTVIPDEIQIVFLGGIPFANDVYNPNINVAIAPVGKQKIDLEILEKFAEMMIQIYKEETKDFKKIAQKTEVIDGKQAILLECEALYPNLSSFHVLQTVLYDGEFMWIITTGVVPPLSFNTFKDDIYAISRSLKILRNNANKKMSMSFFNNIGDAIGRGFAKGLGLFLIYLIFTVIKKVFSLFNKKL